MTEPETPSRDHLENSRQLAWDRTCSAPGWIAALDHLLGLLEAAEDRQRARRSADRDRLKETLGALVLGLYAGFRGDPERWQAYSRNANEYGARRRYVLPKTTAKVVSTAADFLVVAGLAEHRRGSYTRNPFGGPGGRGYMSRIRARKALVDLLEQEFGVTVETLDHADWSETIRRKCAPETPRGPKALDHYLETSETGRMRAELAAQNAFLAGFQIDLEGDDDDFAVDEDDEEQDDGLDAADRAAPRLYRVFNNQRWDHGGRFYGGWWQGLRKVDRQRLLIDGEETVELDYRALHPRLCYHLQGQPLGPEVDPYGLPGLEGEALRGVVKTVFNQLLNIDAKAKPRAPAGVTEALKGVMNYKALVGLIERTHAPIGGWLRAGRGVELQYLDSKMASSVMGYLRSRAICCLPVHDSFIVPCSAEFILGQTMALAYHGVLSGMIEVRAWPVISGWTSSHIEEQVNQSLN